MGFIELTRVFFPPRISTPSYTQLMEDPRAYPISLFDICISLFVWPSIVALPLILTYNDLYKEIFPSNWYDLEGRGFWLTSERPSPLGLTLGILAVIVGQVFILLYFFGRKLGYLGSLQPIQKEGAPKYDLIEGVFTHLAQPEGFVMLGGYLIGTWMTGLMPQSYYSFSGGINWGKVLLQLLIQDFIQMLMHFGEHKISSAFYRVSHKPHHRFTNPKLFDAFNGSVPDTFCMILVPLMLTARLVNANVWEYMCFGSLYANWLTLIHAEYVHPWDKVFKYIGFGTAADHHIHHKLFKFNYGHLFMYWDMLFNTYKSPSNVPVFNAGI